MNRLFLVRHGITAWNAEGRYQGQIDIPLSEEGRAQAEALRARLQTQPFDACYTSMLSRARHTAEIILTGRDCPLTATPDLNEMNYGAWEGLTRGEIMEHYQEDWERLLRDPVHAAPTNGESRAVMQQRVARALEDIARRHDHATILIASHGGTIRAVVAHYLRLPLLEVRRVRLDNTSITIVDAYNGEGVLTLLNDTGHLGDDKPPLPRLPAH